MRTTLITTKGKVFVFTVAALAPIYQQAYGGTIITDTILVDQRVSAKI